MGKKFRYGTTSILEILLITGILVLINIFSMSEFRRVDLTKNHEYTISQSTKKILSELDDIVNVNIFMSAELPPEFLSLKRQIQDMMQEFQAYSNSNFRLKYVDPKDDPKAKQQAQMAGINEITAQVIQQDQMKVVQVYLGVLVEHENKTEAIPVVTDVKNLEYDLMSRIVKVLQKENEVPSIGILQGHGEPGTSEGNQQQQQPPGELAFCVKKIREQYKAFDVKLDNRAEVPSTVKTLIVVNPNTIPDIELYAIDQFVMNGGKLICFVNGVKGFENPSQPPVAFDSGITPLLNNWGIKVKNDLILDNNCVTVRIPRSQTSFSLNRYPFWMKILKENFDQKSPATSKLESAIIQWPSSIEFLKEKLEGIQSTIFIKSSKESWLMDKDFNLSPVQDFNALPTGDQFNIAVDLKGSFKSYFEGKDLPVDPQTGKAVGGGEKPFKIKGAPTQIAVISTQFPLMSQNWNPQAQQTSEVATFILNLIDTMNLGNELINIRARQATEYPLNQEMIKTPRQKAVIKYLNLFAIPVLVVLIGIIRFVIKRGRKIRFEREFKSRESASD